MGPPAGPISLVIWGRGGGGGGWGHIIGDIGPPTRPHIPRDMGPMLVIWSPPPIGSLTDDNNYDRKDSLRLESVITKKK